MLSGPGVVIIGGGHAGGRVAQHLRSLGFGRPITVVSSESRYPYERPALSKEMLIGTKAAEEVALQSGAAWGDTEFILNVDATRVDFGRRQVALSSGCSIAFEQLVVASGGTPRRLPFPAHPDPRVVTMRTLDDSLALKERLETARRIVVVGGGVIGLEVAAAARALEVEATVLEASDRLAARIGPPILSSWLLQLHRQHGVEVVLNALVDSITGEGAQAVVGGRAGDGRAFSIGADVVLIAVGIEPSVHFLEGSGIATNNGIAVDAFCRLAHDRNCYAVGDVANTFNPLYGRHVRLETWRNAENQGRAVAEFICGRTEPFLEVPWMWTEQYGRNVQVIGLWDNAAEVVERGDFGNPGSACVWSRDGTVAGGVLIDSGRDRRVIEKLVSERVHVDPGKFSELSQPLRKLA